MARMVKVRCRQRPIGDIRTRQSKHPGQKGQAWNAPPQTVPMEPEIRWANLCKDGHARCTHCGHKGHEEI